MNGECLDALEKANYKVRFRISNAKVKVFRSANLHVDLGLVDAADDLLE